MRHPMAKLFNYTNREPFSETKSPVFGPARSEMDSVPSSRASAACDAFLAEGKETDKLDEMTDNLSTVNSRCQTYVLHNRLDLWS